MGRRSRPAAQRPLDYPHRLFDGIEYRCSLAELALSARHRTGILLQENSKRYRQRFVIGTRRFRRTRSCRTLRYRTGHRKSRRLVRTAVRQLTGHAVQHRCHRLCSPAGSRHHLGYIRKLQREEPHPHEPLFSADHRHARYPLLRARSKCCHHRYPGAGSTGGLPLRVKAERKDTHVGPYHEHRPALYNDDHGGILLVCPDRDPLGSQYTDGSELPGRHLHAG